MPESIQTSELATQHYPRPMAQKTIFDIEWAQTTNEAYPRVCETHTESESEIMERYARSGNHQMGRESGKIAANSEPVGTQISIHKQKLAKKNNRKITVPALRKLLDKQNGKCALSGRVLTTDNVSLDHITPFTSSQDHSIDNVHLVTIEVNRAKGTMSVGDFIRMCNDVANTHPLNGS